MKITIPGQSHMDKISDEMPHNFWLVISAEKKVGLNRLVVGSTSYIIDITIYMPFNTHFWHFNHISDVVLRLTFPLGGDPGAGVRALELRCWKSQPCATNKRSRW